MHNPVKYVLVVDDDPTMQMILQGMVEKAGYKVAIAENGEKALQFLEVAQGNISVILLDYNLPDMDGMKVVESIQEQEALAGIPIVMQSGSTDLKQIRTAIEGGVYTYISKPFPLEALQSVLSRALTKSSMVGILNERVRQGYAPANLIRSSAFVMKTTEDAQSLSILLSTLFPDPAKVFPGMLEVMLNAVEHGTLGFGYEDKAAHIQDGTFFGEAQRRESLKENLDKEVEVQFIHKEGRLSVRITDDGGGFDWKSFIDFKVKRKSFLNGYGILKAYQSFDEVKYNTAGNQVTVSVFKA